MRVSCICVCFFCCVCFIRVVVCVFLVCFLLVGVSCVCAYVLTMCREGRLWVCQVFLQCGMCLEGRHACFMCVSGSWVCHVFVRIYIYTLYGLCMCREARL